MAVTPIRNGQRPPLPSWQTPPPSPKLGSPKVPKAPEKQRHTERRADDKCSPTHVPRRRLSQTLLRDRAAHLEHALNASSGAHTNVFLTLRPRTLFVDEAEYIRESQVALQDTDQRDTFDVENLSLKLQEQHFGGARSTDELENVAGDEESDAW